MIFVSSYNFANNLLDIIPDIYNVKETSGCIELQV